MKYDIAFIFDIIFPQWNDMGICEIWPHDLKQQPICIMVTDVFKTQRVKVSRVMMLT